MPNGDRPSSSTQPGRLPSTPLVHFLRWWLPAIVIVAGIVAVILGGGSDTSLEGGAGIVGAGAAIWLMNWLWRLGVSGDRDRDKEQAARAYFDEHGRWPDEPAPRGVRRDRPTR